MSDLSVLKQLLRHDPAASALLDHVALPDALAAQAGPVASRAQIAIAMNMQLLSGLLERVPTGRAYIDDKIARGEKLMFDHGALRTVALAGMGDLPAGETAITRILLPLGYSCTNLYPMPRLKMTGRSYTQQDWPADLPQFFVSELHPEHFSPAFQAAVRRVTATSRDPLDAQDHASLETLTKTHALPIAQAIALLPKLVACFSCRHDAAHAEDYAILLAESAEMAWIATEGNAFNHATDRVGDLEAVVEAQNQKQRRVKDRIEVSKSGRVRQTAFHADPVQRWFHDGIGNRFEKTVPGSFFEFIQRANLPDSQELDLAFDTNNAQAIFKMTAAS